MALTRQQQLEFCKICLNREFSSQKGIICNKTNEKAAFTSICDDFEKDEQKSKKIEQNVNFKNRIKPDFTFGLDNLGIKNGVVAGIIFFSFGLFWLFLGIYFGNKILAYPLVFILVGIIAIIISLINKARRNIRGKNSASTTDSNLIDN